MADVVNGWLMSNALDTMAQDMRRRKEEAKQNELRRLAGSAYAAPEGERQEYLNALAQAGGTDLAFGLESKLRERETYSKEQVEANRQYFQQGIALFKSIPDNDPRKQEAYQRFLANMPDKRIAQQIQAYYPQYTPQMAPIIADLEQKLAASGASDPAAVRTANYWREMYANGTPEEKIIAARQLRLLSGPGQLGVQATGDGYYVTDPNRGLMTPIGVGQVGASSAPMPMPSAPAVVQAPRVTTADEAYQVIGDQAYQMLMQRMKTAIQQGQVKAGEEARTLFDQEMIAMANQVVSDANRGGGQPTPTVKPPRTPEQARTEQATATEMEDINARQTKFASLKNVESGLARIEAALNELDKGKIVDTGPIDQWASRFMEEGNELEAAVGGIRNSILALTRVPGIGSQSDLEARLDGLRFPSLGNYPNVNKRTMAELRAFIADLKKAYLTAIERDKKKLGGVPANPPAETNSIDALLEKYKD